MEKNDGTHERQYGRTLLRPFLDVDDAIATESVATNYDSSYLRDALKAEKQSGVKLNRTSRSSSNLTVDDNICRLKFHFLTTSTV